jgi:hypothetical protein
MGQCRAAVRLAQMAKNNPDLCERLLQMAREWRASGPYLRAGNQLVQAHDLVALAPRSRVSHLRHARNSAGCRNGARTRAARKARPHHIFGNPVATYRPRIMLAKDNHTRLGLMDLEILVFAGVVLGLGWFALVRLLEKWLRW